MCLGHSSVARFAGSRFDSSEDPHLKVGATNLTPASRARDRDTCRYAGSTRMKRKTIGAENTSGLGFSHASRRSRREVHSPHLSGGGSDRRRISMSPRSGRQSFRLRSFSGRTPAMPVGDSSKSPGLNGKRFEHAFGFGVTASVRGLSLCVADVPGGSRGTDPVLNRHGRPGLLEIRDERVDVGFL